MNELLLKLIDMSITASILIAIILVIRIGFKKIPRKYICVLWALVAIRLVCPLNIESPFSAYNVVIAVFLASMLLILISIFEIYEIFKGRHQTLEPKNQRKMIKIIR